MSTKKTIKRITLNAAEKNVLPKNRFHVHCKIAEGIKRRNACRYAAHNNT